MSAPLNEEKPPSYASVTGDNQPPAGGYAYQGAGPPPAGAYQGAAPKTGPYAGAPYPPQQGYQGGAPPPGYVVSGQPSYMVANTTIAVVPQTSVVVVGGCPACRVGVLEDDFTCLGVCCAIFFFPLGILCCLAMRQRRCPNCGAIFG